MNQLLMLKIKLCVKQLIVCIISLSIVVLNSKDQCGKHSML